MARGQLHAQLTDQQIPIHEQRTLRDDQALLRIPADATVRDLLEVLDDCYDRASTLITSQLPLDQWHGYLGDRTVADAILDRLVHNAHKLTLKGDSMRKARSAANRKDR